MINGFVQGQALKIVQPLVVSDTIDYLEASFVFRTAEWNGLSKWAHFEKGDKKYKINLIEDKVKADQHLNLDAGEWSVFLHGDGVNGTRITTEPQKITVQKTGNMEGGPLPELPLEPAEQIAAQAQRAEDKATEALTEVKKVAPLAQKASDAAEAAAKSADSADASARSAGSSAASASGSAERSAASEKQIGVLAGQIEQDKNAVDQLVQDAQAVAAGINRDVLKAGELANQIGRDALAVSQDKQTVVSAKRDVDAAKTRVEALEKGAKDAKAAAETASRNSQASETASFENAENAAGSAARAETAKAGAEKSAGAASGSAAAAAGSAGEALTHKQEAAEQVGFAKAEVTKATEQAEKAKQEADRAKSEADKAATAVSEGIKAQKKYIDQTFANAFVDHAVGEVIASDMVSPVEHNVGCKVESRNLIQFVNSEAGGVVSVVTNDGKIHLSGTSTREIFFLSHNKANLKRGKKYFLFGCPESGGRENYNMYLSMGEGVYYYDYGKGVQVSPEDDMSKKVVLHIFPNTNVDGLVFSPCLVESNLPVAKYTPYISDLSTAIVRRYGKNLVDYRLAEPRKQGQTIEIVPDGVKWSGDYYFQIPCIIPSGTSFFVSFDSDISTSSVGVVFDDGTRDALTVGYPKSFIKKIVYIYLYKKDPTVAGENMIFKNIQVRLQGTSEEYEPPVTRQDFTPSPYGTTYGMTSVSPNMTILSDTPGVLIQADYNLDGKKYVDKKFAELQSAILSQGANI